VLCELLILTSCVGTKHETKLFTSSRSLYTCNIHDHTAFAVAAVAVAATVAECCTLCSDTHYMLYMHI
jgi:hypothetical protein